MRKNTDWVFLISRLKSSLSSVYDVNAKRNPVFYEFFPITATEDTNIKHFSLLLSYSSVFVIAAILAFHIASLLASRFQFLLLLQNFCQVNF